MPLREQVLRGGMYLTLRQIVGLIISLGGVLLLTRLIGPTNYGLYAGALGISTFASLVARMGVDIYLVRRERIVDDDVYHQAFSFLLLTGLGIGMLGFVASPMVVQWIGDPRFLDPLRALFLALPFTILSAPAMARLERALDYRKVASLELVGQILFYVLALLLAWGDLGFWAPIIGYFLLQIWTVASSYSFARYRPRLFWSRKLLEEMLRYGSGYSASLWVWQLRILVNPLIVGRFLGPEAVGYVALAIRLVEALSFVKTATWRLSISAFAKAQRDLPRLRRALEEAMVLQTMSIGPFLLGFSLVAPWILPILFGDQWQPVLTIYSFIALGYMANAVFTMHSSVLYVLQRNWAVTIFHLAHVALFAGTVFLLLPNVGLIGYGLAEVGALGTYLILHLYLTKVFDVGYYKIIPWLLGFVPPLFFPLIESPWGMLLWFCPLLIVFSRTARTQVGNYLRYFRKENNG